MPMRRRSAYAFTLAAGVAALAASPAAAQVYFRPYGGVYVERYYGPPPDYYAPPPVYRAPRAGLPPQDVEPMLRSMGMRSVGRVRADGPTYLVDATDAGGVRQRVRIDAMSGRIIAMHEIGRPAAPVAAPTIQPPAGAEGPGRRYASPAEAGVPGFVAPTPPKRPPELAAVPAPAPIVPEEPAAAPPSAEPPPAEAHEPAEAATDGAAPPPAETAKPAEPAADPQAVARPGAVRVIPGVAVPPGTAPDAVPADAGSGTGTGTATGEDASAGTASVIAREKPPATPAP